jgi:DNA-directed RNA polymerase specialized sigma24 family protein
VAYHYVVGLAYAEIAGILGGTTDAARRAAADGIKNLRKTYPGAAAEGNPS